MIKLIVLDVDGTLTNGDIIYTKNDDELKTFNVKDGLGIALWKKLGKEVAIITGRTSNILEKRVVELNIKYLRQGVQEKKKALDEILQELQLNYEEIAVIGDDLNDVSMLKTTKYSFCPKDSHKRVKKLVWKVLKSEGGKGAVREMIDFLIKKERLGKKVNEIFGI